MFIAALHLPRSFLSQKLYIKKLLADVFPTGYHASELAQVSTGDSVAIFGEE
jgi:threonine dehydrogenase-like Zn-dependent dehydrogenase